MRALPAMALAALLAGCWSGGDVPVAQYRNGPVRVSVRAPQYARDATALCISTNGEVSVVIGSSQPAAEIGRAEGAKIRMRVVNIGLVLLFGLSLLVLFLPEWIVSNKDALIGMAGTAALFVVVRYAEASAPAMAWIVPVLALAAAAYLAWSWRAGRKRLPADSAE